MNSMIKEIKNAYEKLGTRDLLRFSKPISQAAYLISDIMDIYEKDSLRNERDFDLDNAIEVWQNACNNKLSLEDAYKAYFEPTIVKPNEDEDYFSKYLKLLEKKKWRMENIKCIKEQASLLVKRTSEFFSANPGKLCSALVVGNVQSGKTANYCADINYWISACIKSFGEEFNTFIVLTDNNTSLGNQTKKRLKQDIIPISEWIESFTLGDDPEDIEDTKLITENYDIGFILSDDEYSNILKKISAAHNFKKEYPQNWSLTPVLPKTEDANQRCLVYLAIKNKKSLERIKNDFVEKYDNVNSIHPSTGVVIIDDEADIITPTATPQGAPGAVRREILGVIESFRNRNIPVIYVAFTATPYANILNTPPSEDQNPLFPHIIQVLNTSDEYFGTDFVLGRSGDAPGWVHRLIDSERPIEKGELSGELKNAFAWFLCTVAARRKALEKNADGKVQSQPTSMMIHISNLTQVSKKTFSILKEYAKNSRNEIMERCENSWLNERYKCTIKDLPESYPDKGNVEKFEFEFEELKEKIEELLEAEGTDKNASFSKGLNFRLLIGKTSYNNPFHYPVEDKEKEAAGLCPAFVIIGGNCISRGLTLEGLTSIYFRRNTQYNDTLLQFARWNGYRRGFELLPRIWISNRLIDCFRYASYMETVTRLKMNEQFKRKTDHWIEGVKVYGLPNAGLMPTGKMLFANTSVNKKLNYDSNVVPHDPDKWHTGVMRTSDFLEKIGDAAPKGNKQVWFDVDKNEALSYLRDMKNLYDKSNGLNSLMANEEKLRSNNIHWNVAFVPMNEDIQDRIPCPPECGFFSGIKMRHETEKSHVWRQSGYGSRRVHADFSDYVADINLDKAGIKLNKKELLNLIERQNKKNDVLILIYLHEPSGWERINEQPGHEKDPVILLSVRWASDDKYLIHSIELGQDGDEVEDNLWNENEEKDFKISECKKYIECIAYTLKKQSEDDDSVEDDIPEISCSFTLDQNNQPVCYKINSQSELTEQAEDYLKKLGYDFLLENRLLQCELKLNNIGADELAKGLSGNENADRNWWIGEYDEKSIGHLVDEVI